MILQLHSQIYPILNRDIKVEIDWSLSYGASKYSWVLLQHDAIYHDITYSNAMTAAEHQLNSQKDTP